MSRLPKRLSHDYEELKRLCHSGEPLDRLQQQVAERLLAALDGQALALMLTDPVTFLSTEVFTRGMDARAGEVFFGRVYITGESKSFLDMRRQREDLALLSTYTGGRLESEGRYREIYLPQGLKHEVRVCLHTGDSYWGGLCVARGDDSPDFTAGEQQFLSQVAPHLAEGIRSAVLRRASGPAEAQGTTTLLLDRENRVLFRTRQADEILEGFRPPGSHGQDAPLPPPFQAVVALLRSQPDWAGAGEGAPEAKVTSQDRAGRWWSIAALEPEAGNHPDIATVLVVSPSHTADRFPRLVAVYNLTPREREMVELVAAGLSTKEIAGRLFVTPYTVQDHLKKIFEKMGVTSRRELMALVFRHGSPVGP